MTRMPPLHKLKKGTQFETSLLGNDLVFQTTWGLFSPKGIDEGSRLLLGHMDVDAADKSIDVGCGYGAIGVALAKYCRKGSVQMVDRDFVAVEYANKNAKRNRCKNTKTYLSNGFSEVPTKEKATFDNVVSNLPAKVGKEMIYIIMRDAKTFLKPGGTMTVVVISGLKDYIKREFKDIFGNYRKVKQGRTHAVLSATKHKE